MTIKVAPSTTVRTAPTKPPITKAPQATKALPAAFEPSEQVASTAAQAPPTGPAPLTSWDAIKVGSLVLATTGHMEGWFECIVRFTRADDAFVLTYRDWPHEPKITRRRDELALLHPGTDPHR